MAEMFGPYEVLELVATGSTGRVYRVRHHELGRIAAVKELSPQLRDVPGVMERLRAEAEVLSGLSHPNIVHVYDYVEEPHRAWLAEEWVDGTSLQAILDVHDRLTPEQSLGVVRGALTGLAYAHERGVVHRDVSTGNILADQEGTSKLVDFGLAAPAGAGAAIGTPAFLSPESARGESVGKPGDVYSAAAVLFTLLAGRTPFAARDALAMARAHIEEPAPRFDNHGADIADLLRRSLSKDPDERPADAGVFLGELEEVARRRFGAGWLGRASITGLVGAAAAGGAVAGGAGVGAAAAHGVQTVVFDAARAGSALPTVISAATKPVRSLASKLAVAGGVGVATAVVAVGAYAVTNGSGDNGDDPSAGSSPGAAATSQTSTPTPTPKVDPVVDTDPVGVWNLRSSVVKSDNPAFAKVGSNASNTTWRFTPTCADAATCGGAIKSSSGRAFQYTWNGHSITIASRDPDVTQGLCTDDAGKKAPGTHFKEVQKSSVVRLIGNGTRYVGTAVVSSRVTELRGNCVNAYAKTGAPAPHATYRWVLSAK
jgi:eukaryotic-like serine/threonine-protein kinase